MGGWMHANPWTAESKRVKSGCKSGTYCYPRRARSALGVDTVLTLDVCLYVCMYVC